MGAYEDGYDPELGYNPNAFAHKTLPQAAMGKVVELIAIPIGLASEAIHNRKDRRLSATSPKVSMASGEKEKEPTTDGESCVVAVSDEQARDPIASGQAVPADGKSPTHELVASDEKAEEQIATAEEDVDQDEADWALDEAGVTAADPPPEYTASSSLEPPVEELVRSIRASTKTGRSTAQKRLPFPVVLPQRRPGAKTRGFIRAYAPVLQDNGIDQDMFLQFLKSFHAAAQASPVFQCIIVGTAIAGLVPEPTIGIAMQALQILAGVGQEMQERWRANKFLNQANKQIFMPRGLLALVVTYRSGEKDSEDSIGTMTVDIGATAMAKYGGELLESNSGEGDEGAAEMRNKSDDLRLKMQRLRVASAKTHESEMPIDCAPLVYPALDSVQDGTAGRDAEKGQTTVESLKAKSKSSQKFVVDYFDRRARATYAAANPKSQLTARSPTPQFKSRFADPSNHTNKHFFTLITGGKFKAEPLGAKRRWERAQRQMEEKRAQGMKENPRKRLMQEHVLYLMVVNMPTESEMAKAKQELHEAKERKRAERMGGDRSPREDPAPSQ